MGRPAAEAYGYIHVVVAVLVVVAVAEACFLVAHYQ